MVNDTQSILLAAHPARASTRTARRRRAIGGACAALLLSLTLGSALSARAIPQSPMPNLEQAPLSQQIADGTPSPNGPCGGIAAGC